MASVKDYENFDSPISELLDESGYSMLTSAAKELMEGDLVALAWKNHTSRTDKLSIRDLDSIEEAFSKHSLRGNHNTPIVGSGCCCTCTPACCCTAVAVIKSA